MVRVNKSGSLAVLGLLLMVVSGSATAEAGKEQTDTKSIKVEEIVVQGSCTTNSMNSATGLDMSLRETPQSVTVMTSQMIEDKGLVDMEEVLDHVPGVSKVGDASEFSIVYVRGFQLDSGVQVDGQITTTANPTYSGATSQGIDPVVAERVEVLKGAAGILSGLGEPSATVNMIRKRPTEEFQAYVSAGAGSWSTYRTEGDVSGPLISNGKLRGRLVSALLDNESYIDRYSREKSVIYGMLEGDVTPSTELSLALDRTESNWDGVYNWNSNPAFYTDGTLIDHNVSFSTGQNWSYRDVQEWSVMPEVVQTLSRDWKIKASFRSAKATIDVLNPTMGAYVDRESGDLVSPNALPYALHSDRKSDTTSYNIYGTGSFELFGASHDLVLGYNYSKNEFTLLSHYAELPTYNLADTSVPAPDLSLPSSPYAASGTFENSEQSGLYTTVRLSLHERLKFMLGGRLSDWEVTSNNLLNLDTAPVHAKKTSVATPYAGIVYEINDYTSVYTSHTGIFLPVRQYGADGNLLEPTEGTNTEAGIKLAFYQDQLNVSAAIYQAKKDNVAEWADMGMLPNGYWIYESVDGIKTDGYEIEIAGMLKSGWNISSGYTFNKAEDEEGNRRTTYIPNKVFKFTSSVDLAGKFAGFTVGASARWQSSSYYPVTLPASITTTGEAIETEQSQSAFWLMDLMARYNFNSAWAVSINVNNIFDKVYNRSLWGYADYGDPRNAHVSVRYDF